MKRISVIIICAIVALANSAIAISQEKQHEPMIRRAPRAGAHMGGSVAVLPGDQEVHFVGTELSFSTRLVKGVPYSAEAITENVQALADGNRIVRKSSSMIYRDSEGRTRHERTMNSVGPYSVAGEAPQMVFINDPVGGFNYILDPRNKTARKMGRPRILTSKDGSEVTVHVESALAPSAVDDPRHAEKIMIESTVAAGGMKRRSATVAPAGEAVIAEAGEADLKKPTVESLGKQIIEGVEAEGTRSTITIPAGKIGNELPIQIVSETWYSPELQVVVMTRHTDPRFGEQSFRLTGINRGEPAKTLFELPSDYTIKDTVAPGMRMRVERDRQRQPLKQNEQQ